MTIWYVPLGTTIPYPPTGGAGIFPVPSVVWGLALRIPDLCKVALEVTNQALSSSVLYNGMKLYVTICEESQSQFCQVKDKNTIK